MTAFMVMYSWLPDKKSILNIFFHKTICGNEKRCKFV